MDIFSISMFMRTLLLSSAVTLGIYFCDSLRKKNERSLYYLAFFFWFFMMVYVINYLIPS